MKNTYFIFCVVLSALLGFMVYEYTHLQNKVYEYTYLENKVKLYESAYASGYEAGFKMGNQEYFLEKFFMNHVEYVDISESNMLSSKVNVLGKSKNIKAQVLKFKND